MAVSGCKKDDADNNSDSGKLPPLPDKTDVCSAMDDATFIDYCYKNFDTNKDGKISELEYNAVKEINCNGLQITSFKGIEYFANLETFSCENNEKIKEIDLSHNKNITIIGDSAFSKCTNLQRIKLPNSIAETGKDAFYGCTSLKGVYITDIAAWCNIKFDSESYSTPLYYANNLYLNGELVTDLVIPNSVTTIGDVAFAGCTCLTGITIPDSVTTISVGAFSGCTGLTSVTIPDSVTTIGRAAFSGCTGLTSVTIPDSVTTIGNYAFWGCTGLTSVTILIALRQSAIVHSGVAQGLQALLFLIALRQSAILHSVVAQGLQALPFPTVLRQSAIMHSIVAQGLQALLFLIALRQSAIMHSIVARI